MKTAPEKIKLAKCKGHDNPFFAKNTKSVQFSLPYFKTRQGEYFHRVRHANNHWRGGELSHTSVGFWCGNGGFIGEKGRLYAKIPEGGVLCATCEGKAIGAGLDGERKINGKKVMYSPKTIRKQNEKPT